MTRLPVLVPSGLVGEHRSPRKPPVEVVEVDVGQEWAEHAALRRPFAGPLEQLPFHHACPEESPDQAEEPLVPNALPQLAQQLLMMDMVEEALNVPLDHPVVMTAANRRPVVRLGDRGVTGPSRPEAVAEIGEVAFEDGFQDELECHLDPAVIERGHAQWAHLAILFGNVDTLDGHRLEGPRTELFFEASQVEFPALPAKYAAAEPVEPRCTGPFVGKQPCGGCVQHRVPGEEVVEMPEAMLRALRRFLREPLL